MGGRGASSGTSKAGNRYGSQYRTLAKSGNVKIVRKYGHGNETLMETATRGRVYGEVGSDGKMKRIVYFDNSNKRSKQIDLSHAHAGKSPHVHTGYLHDGKAYRPTVEERRMIERVERLWENSK